MAHAPALSSLPSDVLFYIVSFVPTHPRLVVLGTLNRRWRSIVIASLPAFPLHSNSAMRPDVFARLAPLAPAALRTLNIPSFAGHYVPMCHCRLLTHVTSLTSLSLSLGVCCLDIIRRNAGSLTSLSITLLRPFDGEVGHQLAELRLPRLRHCSLDVNDGWVRATTFLKAHAEQLISLELSGEQLLHAVALPSCQHLALRVGPNYPIYDAIQAVRSSIVSLALHVNDRTLAKMPHELRGLILRTTTELRYALLSWGDTSDHPLFDFTNLRKLEIAKSGALGLQRSSLRLATLMQHCTSLTFGRNVYRIQRQYSLASDCLTSLTVSFPGMLFQTLRHPLPNLRTVVLQERVPLRYFINQFDLQRTPMLRSLSIAVYRTQGMRESFTEWLKRLERAGVEELTVACDIKPNRWLAQVTSVWIHVTVRKYVVEDPSFY